jgi:hypothetical protein
MLTPIVISDFSFIPARKHITIYFKEHPVYEFDATYQVTKEAKETIAAIVHGYNTQTRYEIPGRKIREIMENRQFPLVYHDFNSYVADWPEAEASRAWDTNSGKRPAKLM